MIDELMQFDVGGLNTKAEIYTQGSNVHVLITQDREERPDEPDVVMIPIDVYRAIQSKLRIN